MIPYLDLLTQYRGLKEEMDRAVLGTLQSGQYVLGPEVAAFEKEFAEFCRVPLAVGVNSGTSALHLSLLACGIGPGDEVLTTSLTFVATTAAILYTGARPCFVDVDPVTLQLDPSRIEAALTPRTKAILPVHLYGRCSDMDPILGIAQKRGLFVIEDAAQAHGAEYKERRAGSMGTLGCFSFYPGKNLGAYGEGGAITGSDPTLVRKARVLRDWGAERKYHHDLPGFNYRMEALQGAILRVKLRYLEGWNGSRRSLAALYDSSFQGRPFHLPPAPYPNLPVHHVYAIRAARRDELKERLEKEGIQTNIHYPIPVHLQKAYSGLGYQEGDLPITEGLCRDLLSLPLYPELTPSQVEQVVQAVLRGTAALA